MIECLILPDIHGRKFWKDAIAKFPKEQYPNLKIIFLGDYLDPYEKLDNITKKDALSNFIEILDVAKSDRRISLLIGNHDWHYLVDIDQCRIDFINFDQIRSLFLKNLGLFSLTKTLEIGDVKYLFSHAGITQNYINDLVGYAKEDMSKWNTTKEYIDKENDPKYIWLSKIANIDKTNDFSVFEEVLYHIDDLFYTCSISMISYHRGGYYNNGSMIWADICEHLYTTHEIKGYYQIFGHTITHPDGNIKGYDISPNGKSWAMLDASQAFTLDSDGNIEPLEKNSN